MIKTTACVGIWALPSVYLVAGFRRILKMLNLFLYSAQQLLEHLIIQPAGSQLAILRLYDVQTRRIRRDTLPSTGANTTYVSQVNVPWGRRARALTKTCGRIVSSHSEWARTTSERPPGTDDSSSGRRRCTNTGEVHIRGHHRGLFIIIIIIIISQKRTWTVRCSPGWPWWTSGCSACFASWCRCGSSWTCRSRMNTSVVSLLWSMRPSKDLLSKRKSFFWPLHELFQWVSDDLGFGQVSNDLCSRGHHAVDDLRTGRGNSRWKTEPLTPWPCSPCKLIFWLDSLLFSSPVEFFS